MNGKMFLIVYVLVSVLLVIILTNLSDEDSRFNKKRLAKKLSKIGFACRVLEVRNIMTEDKGLLFTVKIDDTRSPEKLTYCCPYEVTDVYINDELVCKMHKLKNTFIKHWAFEYVRDRSRAEIDTIIKKAYKTSIKELNRYFENRTLYDYGVKSFYKE